MTIFETTLGAVEGHVEGGCVRISRLRYAKPPTGHRRFKMAEPQESWLDPAGKAGPHAVPPQLPSRLALVMGDYACGQSEDCLHLDIWIPRGATGPLPVLVFIHGGAFQTGGGSLECYNGGTLAAREQIIVVTISYRLGLLGFMPIEGIIPANLGLHDQRTALRFIRSEIAAFGGDPENITLAGQSAGAHSVAFFMMNAEAPSLFKRAIMLSGMLGMGLRTQNQARELERSFLAKIGADGGGLDVLQEVDVAKLLEVQFALIMETVRATPPDEVPLPFLPIADGDIVPEDPQARFDTGVATWCPMIVGATREEFGAFWLDGEAFGQSGEALLRKRFAEAFPDAAEAMLHRARYRRAPRTDRAVLIDFHTQTKMIGPALRAAAMHSQAGGEAYAYRFDWQSPDPRFGACHCIDLPFVFGNLDTWRAAPMIADAPEDELAGMRDMVQSAIGSFVRTGHPASGPGVEWPAYGSAEHVVYFDRFAHVGVEAPYP